MHDNFPTKEPVGKLSWSVWSINIFSNLVPEMTLYFKIIINSDAVPYCVDLATYIIGGVRYTSFPAFIYFYFF